MSDTTYILQSGQKLKAGKFCRYIGKKTIKTCKVFGVPRNGLISGLEKTSKVYCLDDAAIDIIFSLMSGKPAKIKKTSYLYCLRKELELYGKLRKLKFEFIKYSGLKLKIKEMLDSLEEKHKEIKYSAVKAQLQAASMI